MNYSENHKRRFNNFNGHQKHSNCYNKKARYNEKNKYSIIDQVQSQRGIRGQLVLFQSNLDVPYTVLQNAVDRNGALLQLHITCNITDELKKYYQLKVNKEILAEGVYESVTEAKRSLADFAITNLKKNCFTIFRKVHPRDSPKVDLPSFGNPDNISTNLPTDVPAKRSMKEIGAKMMLQMGWSGGGLGAKEQGCTNIIQPYIQIQRQGLGTKNIVQEVTKVLQAYVSSNDINSIAFSPDFTKEERLVIHEVARKLNLKSRSYGKGNNRVLVIQSKVKSWDLIRSLLDIGGENDQLRLILPTEFKNDM